MLLLLLLFGTSVSIATQVHFWTKRSQHSSSGNGEGIPPQTGVVPPLNQPWVCLNSQVMYMDYCHETSWELPMSLEQVLQCLPLALNFYYMRSIVTGESTLATGDFYLKKTALQPGLKMIQSLLDTCSQGDSAFNWIFLTAPYTKIVINFILLCFAKKPSPA